MQSSALKWFTMLVLIPTMGWKVGFKPEDPSEVHDAIVKFLKDQKFDVRTTGESIENMPVIEGKNEACRLRIARVSPFGYEAELVRRASVPNDRIFYVFRGVQYREQPVRRTLANYFWFRFLQYLHWVSRIPPVFAVMTSCVDRQIPWTELGAQEPT